MVKAKVFKLLRPFKSFPEASDVKLVEEELPPLKDGEFLAEALYISVDPYVSLACEFIPVGATVIGEQVARIVESNNKNFPVGKLVVGTFGWRTHTVSNGKVETFNIVQTQPFLLSDTFANLSPSLSLGVLGTSGNSAFFALEDKTQPKSGDVFVVSAAAGAVGSTVGQIAKIKGCKVIGIAGSEEKGKWLIEELGFDHFINYKTQDVDKELSKIVPEGVDCYFDNVGGKITASVVKHMKMGGHITIVGIVSKYNEHPLNDNSLNSFDILLKELTVKGFIINNVLDKWDIGIKQLKQWIKEGKIKYKETITKGFENTFNAFVDVLKGGNVGKAVVKV